jgi:hypothetical protein
MPLSTEILSQGSGIAIASKTLGATVTIPTITAANPPVANATAHGYANGDFVLIEGFSDGIGALLNQKVWRVANVTPNTFEIAGANGLTLTSATGGTAKKVTFTFMENAKNITLPSPAASEIDVTHLTSDAMEYKQGLRDFGSTTFDYGVNHTGAGFKAFAAAQEASENRYFVVRAGTSNAPHSFTTFFGFVKTLPYGQLGVNQGATASGEVRVSGAPNLIVA